MFVCVGMPEYISSTTIGFGIDTEIGLIGARGTSAVAWGGSTFGVGVFIASTGLAGSDISSSISLMELLVKLSSSGNTVGMNRAMQLKEKLLGYHGKDTILEFNQENNYNINKPVYNFSVLQEEEKNRLNGYLQRVVVNAS